MKKVRLNSQVRKAFRGRSRGFTLIEVVIAMLLLGIIGVAVLGALSYASTVLIVADRQATAESLAKTQMESVKSQKYNPALNGTASYQKIDTTSFPGYTISSVDRDGTPSNDVIGIPWDSNSTQPLPVGQDNGLQKITVIIKYYILRYNISTRGSEPVEKEFRLEDYKRLPVT